MHIRTATRADIPGMATAFSEAFYDDSFFSYRYPYRAKYPEAYRALAVERCNRYMSTPGFYGFVCVPDVSEASQTLPRETILGVCFWNRFTPPGLSAADPWMQNHASWADSLEQTLRKAESWYEQYICPNAAASRENVTAFRKMMNATRHEPLKDILSYWNLTALVVRPAFQGRGIGRLLAQWGIDQTRKEWEHATDETRERREVGLVVTVNSSPAGLRLYQKMGFRAVGDGTGPHLTRPCGGEAHWSMVWDPQGLWTRELEKGEEEYVMDGVKHVVWTVCTAERPSKVASEDISGMKRIQRRARSMSSA